MNILVINGSPKGEYSITYQTVLYLQTVFNNHSYEVLHVGQTYRKYEKDFSEAKAAIEKADLLLFSYPVYTFLVPYQLHRFIELIKENKVDLKGKVATQITTSKHFYDVTAHRFIEDNVKDMGLKYIKGFSADMDDLLTKKGQKDALVFFRMLMLDIDNKLYEPSHPSLPIANHVKVTKLTQESEKKADNDSIRTVAIVADLRDDDSQLKDMIERFSIRMGMCNIKTRFVNIRKANIKGGCLSCFHCASTGECVYKDDFQSMLRNQIQECDGIVLAFSIKDHSMGSTFKMYDDRQFCNGHRTVTMGKPFGYLISGNLSVEENLRMVIEARAEVGGNFLAYVATDEFDPDTEIDTLSKKLNFALKHEFYKPANFYGVGGMKIFRDLIYLMQGLMRADHRFYKEHGQYDFPQKKKGTLLKMYAVGALVNNPKILKKIGKNAMNEGAVKPYKKVIEKRK